MKKLRELRKAQGMTMKQLGAMVGVSESAISQYETGKRNADYELLLQFAEIFGVSIEYLLTGEESPTVAANIYVLPKTKKVPRLGIIACGEPILAVENIEDYDAMPLEIAADFTLICKGNSMINARIFDGDIVYIRKQDTVENGEIAAVLINDEATLKRVRKFEDHIVLEPANPMFEPLVYWRENMNEVRIIGKAVAFTSQVR